MKIMVEVDYSDHAELAIDRIMAKDFLTTPLLQFV